ncbi:ABC-2 transporter permease [Desulfosporosinus sp. FKA]|uniref:ABC-2 transporter permease n=1 Tax=Desulfosporosinus sp. FKA TaxID=1969834 RepID=UPI000B49FD0F|nr:ABC-2 transporter permease [Desulfosporosinus sp. FKA]
MLTILNLIKKDFFILKRSLWIPVFYGFFALIAFSNLKSGVLSAVFVGVAYSLITQACAQDEKNKSEIMVICLPLLRRDIVLAKYFSALLYGIIGLFSYLLAQVVVSFLGISLEVQKITIPGLIGAVSALIILVSIYFPLYFKFGYLRSRMFGMILFFACFFSIPFAAGLLAYSSGIYHGLLLQSVSAALLKFAGWLKFQTDWQIGCYLAALNIIMFSLSAGLSLRFYAHREF